MASDVVAAAEAVVVLAEGVELACRGWKAERRDTKNLRALGSGSGRSRISFRRVNSLRSAACASGLNTCKYNILCGIKKKIIAYTSCYRKFDP